MSHRGILFYLFTNKHELTRIVFPLLQRRKETLSLYKHPKTVVRSPLTVVFSLWAFRYASGFPLYLCSLHFSPLKNISKFPNPRPRIPFTVPLAKDAAAIPNELGLLKTNFPFSTLNFQFHKALPHAIYVSPFQGVLKAPKLYLSQLSQLSQLS